jgi:hypothetical protein
MPICEAEQIVLRDSMNTEGLEALKTAEPGFQGAKPQEHLIWSNRMVSPMRVGPLSSLPFSGDSAPRVGVWHYS